MKLRMDGVKFMIRLNPMDKRSKYTGTLQKLSMQQSQLVFQFLSRLYVETTETGVYDEDGFRESV